MIDNQLAIDAVFDKVLLERAQAVLDYIKALDANGVDNNTDAHKFYAIIADSDRHLKALLALGATPNRLPMPVNLP